MKKIACTLAMFVIACSILQAQSRWFRPDELYSYGANALSVDARGTLWSILSGVEQSGKVVSGIQYFDGRHWITVSDVAFGYPQGMTSPMLQDLACTRLGDTIVVAAEDHLMLFDRPRMQWSTVDYSDTFTVSRYYHVHVDSKGRIWVVAEGRLTDGLLTPEGMIVPGPLYNLIFQLRNGRLELMYHQPSAGYWFTRPSEDSRGTIWFACQANDSTPGLIKYDGTSFIPVNVPAGCRTITRSTPTALLIDANDDILIGTSNSVISGLDYPAAVTRIAADLKSYSEAFFPTTSGLVMTLAKVQGRLYAGAMSANTLGGLFEVTDSARNIDLTTLVPEFSAPLYLQYVVDIESSGTMMYCATGNGILAIDRSSSGVREMATADAGSAVIPNPVNTGGAAMLDAGLDDGEQAVSVRIVDAIGREVPASLTDADAADGRLRFDAGTFAPGHYFVQVLTSRRRSLVFPFVVEQK
jgi:hypothetical protein